MQFAHVSFRQMTRKCTLITRMSLKLELIMWVVSDSPWVRADIHCVMSSSGWGKPANCCASNSK